jgi:hypothetical protein
MADTGHAAGSARQETGRNSARRVVDIPFRLRLWVDMTRESGRGPESRAGPFDSAAPRPQARSRWYQNAPPREPGRSHRFGGCQATVPAWAGSTGSCLGRCRLCPRCGCRHYPSHNPRTYRDSRTHSDWYRPTGPSRRTAVRRSDCRPDRAARTRCDSCSRGKHARWRHRPGPWGSRRSPDRGRSRPGWRYRRCRARCHAPRRGRTPQRPWCHQTRRGRSRHKRCCRPAQRRRRTSGPRAQTRSTRAPPSPRSTVRREGICARSLVSASKRSLSMVTPLAGGRAAVAPS